MLRSRSKSVDMRVGTQHTLSSYNWKTNLLCGVYADDMTSSIFYTTEDKYVTKDHNETVNTMSEKIKTRNTKKNATENVKTVGWQERIKRLTIRSRKGGRIASDQDKELSRLGMEEDDRCTPILFRAVAVRDCVPSPYDRDALSFKVGDKIGVTMVREDGVWRGLCRGREGHFKFIDVKRMSPLLMRRKNTITRSELPRSQSVSDLLSAISLENLTPVFVLNGYNTVDDFEDISNDDLDYLGITDADIKGLIIDTLSMMNKTDNKYTTRISRESCSSRDSGLSSSSESILSYHDLQSSPAKSFLHQRNKHKDTWRDSAVFVTEVTLL